MFEVPFCCELFELPFCCDIIRVVMLLRQTNFPVKLVKLVELVKLPVELVELPVELPVELNC
jgi:hypothetical protein